MAKIFTDANFKAEVLDSDKISMIDFWATWCPPCLALGPIVDELEKKYEGKINVGKVNTDENPGLSVTYGITNLPCILFIKEGEVINRNIGFASKAVYDKKIQAMLEQGI